MNIARQLDDQITCATRLSDVPVAANNAPAAIKASNVFISYDLEL